MEHDLPLLSASLQAESGFRLHPALDATLYHMPGSLKNVAQWKAFCYVGNDCGEDEARQMQNVGYVMVSRIDNTIIPIARGDEHHRGYDLLHDLAAGDYPGPGSRKQKALPIRAADYVPVWAYGNNYVYGPKDIPVMLEALRKWLAWGGADGIVWGANDMRGKALSSIDFVAHEGVIDVVPGRLANIGGHIHRRLTDLSATLVRIGPSPDRAAMGEAYDLTSELLTFIKPFGYQIGLNMEWQTEARKRLRDVRRSGDSQKLWEFLFGFHGVKNAMHVYLREEAGKDSPWSADGLKAIWGDPYLAIDMLGRL